MPACREKKENRRNVGFEDTAPAVTKGWKSNLRAAAVPRNGSGTGPRQAWSHLSRSRFPALGADRRFDEPAFRFSAGNCSVGPAGSGRSGSIQIFSKPHAIISTNCIYMPSALMAADAGRFQLHF
jgi:hypothetical protein